MIVGRNFIIISPRHWDNPMGTTIKNAALEISKRNRVLFIGPPLQRSYQLLKNKIPEVRKYWAVFRGNHPNLRQVNDNLIVFYPKTVLESINLINNNRIYDFLLRLNERRFARQILKAVRRLNFKEFIILNDTSMLVGFYLKELLSPKLNIYLIRDAVVLVGYHSKHGKLYEEKMIGKSDLVVTNSEPFADYARKFNPNSHMIGQGCDVSLYSDPDGQLAVPGELESISHPRIGFTGYLNTIRLDIDILIHIAEQRPGWNIVLVGPEDEDFRKSRLHQLPNVFFPGRKDLKQLPGYIKGFDVTINPQLVNLLTDTNYPLKIDEYLSMGKPIVATKTRFMSYFGDSVYLASTREEFVLLIETAIHENSPGKEKQRIDLALSHSWENFAGKIYKQIELLLANTPVIGNK